MDRYTIVLSDLHLGAGANYKDRVNFLEDFHWDNSLYDFFIYFCSGEYELADVEVVINGDFLDFLAVPFVEFFDDEFWSEKASHEKMKIICRAHPLVFQGVREFLQRPNKRVRYILGNHDAEFAFDQLREEFLDQTIGENRAKFIFQVFEGDYRPHPGILIRHGHNYELAHQVDFNHCVIKTRDKENYFIPPWGSYYVTRIVNKYKQERNFINQVRPIRSFIIFGLIFDTLLTLRFIFSNCYYFFRVIVLNYGQQLSKLGPAQAMRRILDEAKLFKNYEEITRSTFEDNPGVKALIVGHTHEPAYRSFPDGTIFINTGTWTKMFNLDFAKKQDGYKLTFALIAYGEEGPMVGLHHWKGIHPHPFTQFRA